MAKGSPVCAHSISYLCAVEPRATLSVRDQHFTFFVKQRIADPILGKAKETDSKPLLDSMAAIDNTEHWQ